MDWKDTPQDDAKRPKISSVLSAMENEIGMTDRHGNLIEANRPFTEKFNCDPGDNFFDLLDEPQTVRDRLHRLEAKGSIRCQIQNRFGPVWLRLTRIKAEGPPVFLIEPKAENSGSRVHRFMMDQLDVGFWDLDVPNQIFRVTETWQRIRGNSTELFVDVSNYDWAEDIHPEDREALLAAVEAQRAGKISLVNIQYRHRHPEQGWVWILCRSTVLERDSKGDPLRIIGVDTEISELKSHEEESERLAYKLGLAMEVAGLGVWEFNAKDMTVTWDDRILEIYGITDGQNVRDSSEWVNHLHPDDRDRVVAYSDMCERYQQDIKCDFRIIHKDGQTRHLRSLARRTNAPFLGERLIGVNIDITEHMERAEELEKTRKQLEYDALHDALTGLSNRRYLDMYLEKLLEKIDPEEQIAIVAIDLDHFKSLNDELGHAAGDAALVRAAGIIRAILPGQGKAFRVGGDEFILVLPKPIEASVLFERCARAIEAIRVPFEFEGRTCSLGCSIGFSFGCPSENGFDALFSQADAALYTAKAEGRNRAFEYAGIKNKADHTTGLMRLSVQSALDKDQLICVYQPQFSVQNLQLSGAEALLRLPGQNGELMLPMAFLEQAATEGLLAEVDRTMFAHVIQHQTLWHNANISYPNMSVNVTSAWLNTPSIVADVTRQIAGHHKISFELLETSVYDDISDEIRYRLDAFREAGIKLVLDDFGSAHASVRALREIRPDGIKIDRSLVSDLARDTTCRDLVDALCRMAHLFGADVLLEGIETHDILEIARTVACTSLQGYHLALPQRIETFEAFLTGDAVAQSA